MLCSAVHGIPYTRYGPTRTGKLAGACSDATTSQTYPHQAICRCIMYCRRSSRQDLPSPSPANRVMDGSVPPITCALVMFWTNWQHAPGAACFMLRASQELGAPGCSGMGCTPPLLGARAHPPASAAAGWRPLPGAALLRYRRYLCRLPPGCSRHAPLAAARRRRRRWRVVPRGAAEAAAHPRDAGAAAARARRHAALGCWCREVRRGRRRGLRQR